jgi:hypothetical protein
MNDSKPLTETYEISEVTNIEQSVERPLLLKPQIDESYNQAWICECEDYMRSACTALPANYEHEGKHYCVLHYSNREKVKDFRLAFHKKLVDEDFNFYGVYFPEEVNFNSIEFKNAAGFRGAIFTADANFLEASFNGEANFHKVTFNAAVAFIGVTFDLKTDFSEAAFIGEADFTAVTFKENAITDFSGATFNAKANFSFVNFKADSWFWAAIFKENAIADFSKAIFSTKPYFDYTNFSADVHFNEAIFNAIASFNGTTFSADVYFDKAIFNAEAYFDNATFNQIASFRYTQFQDVYFREAIFKDYVWFSEKEAFTEHSYLNLQHARIEKPERFSFHTLILQPHWFINVDTRKFIFTAVGWTWEDDVEKEIEKIQDEDVLLRNELFSIACRNLALNAEENHRYDCASDFRYMSMEAERLNNSGNFLKTAQSTFKALDELLGKTDTDDSPARLLKLFQLRREKKSLLQNKQNNQKWNISKPVRWLYWILSGYGERVLRALLVLIGIWLLSAFLYTQVGFARWEPKLTSESDITTNQRDVIGNPLTFTRAIAYSFALMALQKPEPRPATNTAQALVTLETVLGPLQAALLALAIRRKFMR